MGTMPTTDRGRLTRQRIVAAATEVVAEKGALGASLDEVGARAPASRSQLYHYFDDKNDLLLAVAEATNDTVLAGQRDLFDHLDTWDGLVRWADALVAFQQERGGQGGCPIANLLGQLGERDDVIRSCSRLGSTVGRPTSAPAWRPWSSPASSAPMQTSLGSPPRLWPVSKAASFSHRHAETRSHCAALSTALSP
jgi:AcrR family transcriptional regulator